MNLDGESILLHKLSVMKNIREENFVENFDTALEDGIDVIGEQFLGQTIDEIMSSVVSEALVTRRLGLVLCPLFHQQIECPGALGPTA